jgi:CheY-like chemotaxis protein
MASAVLIADDNAAIRALLIRMIQRASPGSTILDVADGTTALDYCRRYGPRVVLLDHGLPDICGFTVLQRLKAVPGAPYVIMITGNADLEQEALCKGADEVWLKPMDVAQMMTHLRHLLAAR